MPPAFAKRAWFYERSLQVASNVGYPLICSNDLFSAAPLVPQEFLDLFNLSVQ